MVIAPNNDPGSDAIARVIEALPAAQFRVIPSMRFAYFSELMRHAKVMVGNSSAGVREAPFLGLPSLDVGSRQHQRAQAPSVHAAAADEAHTIQGFLATQWGQRHAPDTSFGQGEAAARFVKVLQLEAWGVGLQK